MTESACSDERGRHFGQARELYRRELGRADAGKDVGAQGRAAGRAAGLVAVRGQKPGAKAQEVTRLQVPMRITGLTTSMISRLPFVPSVELMSRNLRMNCEPRTRSSKSGRLLPLTLPLAVSGRIQLPHYFGQIFDFKNGAGEGNRTLVISLEGCCSTIELHPHQESVVRDR